MLFDLHDYLMRSLHLMQLLFFRSTKLAKNPIFHKRSKHIDVRAHFVRELAEEGKLIIEHIASKDQVADLLTKPIPSTQFRRLRDKMGLTVNLTF
jgi:hypothetical protein